MTDEEERWREDVLRDLAKLRYKRANHGHGKTTYMRFRERFAAHHREGCRLGIGIDDDLLFKCSMEGRGGFKI